MFRSFRLQPVTVHDKPLVFEWDLDAGQVRGPGADVVRQLVDNAKRLGSAVGHPYPTTYEIGEPLKNAAELAVLLGNRWALDGDLANAYPTAEADDEIEEIGENGEVQTVAFRPLY